jgi:hypothetical protein
MYARGKIRFSITLNNIESTLERIIMKNAKFKILGIVLASLFSASYANANTYDLNFISGTYDLSATITTNNVLNSVGGFDITAITGSITNGIGAITALVLNPNQPNPTTNFGFSYNNVLFPTSQPFDINGVLFTANAGTTTWNLWGTSTRGDYELFTYASQSVPNGVDVHGTLSITAVPEPENYAMIVAGLGLMGFVARRRKNTQA